MHPLLVALQESVLHQDESITQALAWNESSDASERWGSKNVDTPGTPAFHLHHTVLVFRYHARHAMKTIDSTVTDEQLDQVVPHHESPIPIDAEWSPGAVLSDLTRSLNAFVEFMNEQPASVYDIEMSHNRPFTLASFLNMMTRHITWHAAAIHYRARPLGN